jgi:N-acetylglucosamine transport system permease protein
MTVPTADREAATIRPHRPAPRSRRTTRQPRAARILTTLLVGLIAASIVVPVLWVLTASLKQRGEFYGSPWTLPEGLHWQNYVDAFITARMGQYFLNSVLVTTLALALVLVVSVPAAYALARFDFPGRGIIQTGLMAGLFINVNYIVVAIFLMLIGWDRWLIDFAPGGLFIDNRIVLAVVYAATTIPFTVYLLSNYMSTIPVEYEEAATLDGASRLCTMTRVILPMARPGLTTVVLFNFLTYWNDFILALTLLPGENRTLQVGLLNLMTAQRAAADYGRLYAGMVIVIVPVLIFYAVIQKRLIEGIASEGVKG